MLTKELFPRASVMERMLEKWIIDPFFLQRVKERLDHQWSFTDKKEIEAVLIAAERVLGYDSNK